MREVLMIEYVVGYMLKIIKSGIKISIYKNEFDAIRHGDYKTFISLVGGEIPFMVIYESGNIRREEDNPNYKFDFEGLIKSGNSLKIFYENCLSYYGKINDYDVSQEIFQKVVSFEISLRMHANNLNLLNKTEQIKLEKVINILCDFKNIPEIDKNKIQSARKFINMIKHFKNQFPSWPIGISNFLIGYEILEKHKITIL
jgi:hypothetical protein